MKRIVCILLMFVILGSLTSCVAFNKLQTVPEEELNSDSAYDVSDYESEDSAESEEDIETEYREKPHQELTKNKVEFEPSSMLRMSVPEIGLENVIIRKSAMAWNLDDGEGAEVYLLGDDRYGDGVYERFWVDLYLVINYDNDMIYAKDIEQWEHLPSYIEELYLGDIDGDGDCEIVVQELVAMSGGFGGYISLVYDFSDGEINEIFAAGHGEYDTGFQLKVLKDRKINITNKFTGYDEIFDFSHRNEEYWYGFENSIGEERSDFMIDSFFEFEPEDYDNDGIYEIRCCQYTSLRGHADYIGTAVSYLKYNTEKKQFEVVEAWYEPNVPDNT